MKKYSRKQKVYWSDNEYYFLTNSTYLHYPYFREDEQKQLCLNFLKDLQIKWKVPIQAFSLSMNHQHIMFYLDKGEKMKIVKGFLKGNITREYRKIYFTPHKEIWQSSRVYWIKDDKAYFRVMGYIAGNLLKHREVSSFTDLYNCPYASFKYVADKYGWDEAIRMVMAVIDVGEDSDGIVDFKGLGRSNYDAQGRDTSRKRVMPSCKQE